MEITATTLTQLRADKSYYLSNSTGTIKEAGLWQRFKCWTGFGDGREKVRRLADAIKSALLADAFIKSEDKLSSELNGLDKNSSLSGADLRQIATRFKADHAQAIATSDAYRVADKLADEQIARWVKDGDVLPEKKSLEYMKKLALYAAQPVMDEALEYKDDLTRKLSRNIGQIIYCFASMENVKKSYFGYPRFDTYTTEDGKEHTLRVPRLRLDELHFRAVLSCLVTKDGPATFMAFTTAIFKLREEELQKRKEVFLDLKLEPPNKPGSGLAFAAQAANSHEIYNSNIRAGIKMNATRDMPPAFAAAENEVVEEMRQRFGNDAIGPFCSATTLLTIREHEEAIFPLIEKANAEHRTVDADEVKEAIREKCIRGAARAVLNRAFTDIAKEMNIKSPGFSISSSLIKKNPGIIDEIAACTTPEAAAAAARKYEDAIVAKLQLSIAAKNARAGLHDRAVAMIAKEAGLSEEFVAARLKTDSLLDKASKVESAIVDGKIEGSDKPGFDVEAAFNDVLNNFVKGRIDRMKEVDGIKDLSDDLRRKWKNHVISTYRGEKLQPAKIHKLVACGHFSAKQLEEALDENDIGTTATKICSYMGSVNAHFVDLFGAEEWEDMGDDERDPNIDLAMMAVLDANPSIAEKFLARKDELIGALNKEFNTNGNVELGHGRKVVESLYGILVGDDGRKTGE